jgi:hypothetical protein
MLWVLIASGKRGLLEVIKHTLVIHVERAHQRSGIADYHFRVKVFIEAYKNFFAKVFLYFSWTAYYTDVFRRAFVYHCHADAIPERYHNPKPSPLLKGVRGLSLAFNPSGDSIYEVEGSWLRRKHYCDDTSNDSSAKSP